MIEPIASQLKRKPKNLKIKRSTIRAPSSLAAHVSETPAKVKNRLPAGGPARPRPRPKRRAAGPMNASWRKSLDFPPASAMPCVCAPEKPFVIVDAPMHKVSGRNGCISSRLLLVFVARSRHRKTATVVLDGPAHLRQGVRATEGIQPGPSARTEWARGPRMPRAGDRTAVKRAGPEAVTNTGPTQGPAVMAGRRASASSLGTQHRRGRFAAPPALRVHERQS